MNHEIPSGFKEDNKLFLGLIDTDNTDVYLIRVPKKFDIAKLNGTEFNAGEIKEIEVEVGANQLTSVYELSAFSGQGLDVTPLNKSGDTSTVGLPMKGFLSVNKTYRANLQNSNGVCHIAESATCVAMPEGLKVRYQPFGSGSSFKQSSVKRKKKKKRKRSVDTSTSQSTPDVQQVKKRHKTHDEVDTAQHCHKKHKKKRS